MTLAEKVEEIVNNLYPDSNFILASEFQADYESLQKDENPFIVLNNMLEDNDEIKENLNFYTQTRIQISVFIKDEFDTPNSASVSVAAPDSNTLVEEAKAMSRKIYQNLWLSKEVNGELSDGKITHKPTIKELNSIRTGCISLCRWYTNFVISCAT